MLENRYPHVFQPLTIRGVTLKNRLQYAPTVVLKCAPNGDMTQEMLDYMAWQAKTGAAYITVGDTPVVHDGTSAWLCEMNVNSDSCIHGMHALAEAARRNGAEISVELAHAGRGSHVGPNAPPALCPSAELPLDNPNLKTMDQADMDYIKGRYVDCAVRCKKAGFRMVMLHCAHGNMLAQWLSPLSNCRTDGYGGTPENRRRFPLEVLKAVREAVGNDMIVEIRASAQEDTPGGYELPESLDFMEAAQEYVDIIHVSRGVIFTLAGTYTIPTYFKGRQLNVAFAAEAKKRLRVPVCVVGNITSLAEAEEIIASGKADIVAMAKSFMADGDLVQKSITGRPEEVRPCTRCDLCGNANTYGTSMRCAVNPRLGESGPIPPAPISRKVMVIGGGPGGMMAAQTAAARGHRVSLYEKSGQLGGLLNDAVLVPFKEYMRLYLDWDIKHTMRCGADIHLNTEVTLDLVERENPDAIIVATGSHYVVPPIPGIDSALAVRDVDSHAVETGQKVVVCGGGITGMECALALTMEGKEVTVIDMVPVEGFCANMPIFNKADLFDQLEKAGAKLVGGQKIVQFTGAGMETADSEGVTHLWAADSFVNALGVAPENKLALALLAKYPTGVYLVGDCVCRGRTYMDANQEAYAAAMAI
ncbi:MAG: FAD-dependent oxidoreductase [Oscillospiraceae bacterium]|nr:FAD-dependent oxidoreductase [Oscillospiraceae bacterium]